MAEKINFAKRTKNDLQFPQGKTNLPNFSDEFAINWLARRSKKVDLSNIHINVKIERFDHDLDAMCAPGLCDGQSHLYV